MGYLRTISNYLNRIVLSDPIHMMSMVDPLAIGVETLRIIIRAPSRKSSLN